MRKVICFTFLIKYHEVKGDKKVEIKFKKNILDFQYVLCFDLAQRETGCALIDIVNNKIIYIKQISIDKKTECCVVDLYQGMVELIKEINDKFKINFNDLFVLKEQCPQQCSKFTSISTLQSLAKSHCCLDLICSYYNLDIYDFKGVHSVSVKAVFRKILNIENPSKEEIAQEIRKIYLLNEEDKITNDITDAIAVWICLKNHKWNADIDEQIKEYKKKIKELKLKSAKEKIEEKINYLKQIRI